MWSALRCRNSGEVLLSARPGYEFIDWGGDHHVGGGSHGSLHANDSLGALLWCGTGPDSADARTSGRCATSCRWCASTSASPDRSRSAALLRARRRAGLGPDALLARRLRARRRRAGGWRRPTCCARSPRGPRCGGARAKHELTYGRVYYKSRAKHRWQVSFFAPPKGHGREQGDRAGRRRRPQRPGARELDGLQGRVDDGARLRRRVRADRQRAVDLAPAVPAVPAAVRAPAVAAAAPRPAGAARVLGLATRSSRRRGSTSASRSSIRCWSTCSCACCCSRAAREPTARAARRCRSTRSGIVGGVPARLPLRAATSSART